MRQFNGGTSHERGADQLFVILSLGSWLHKSPQGTDRAGGRLNKKDGLTRYGDSHVKDKTS